MSTICKIGNVRRALMAGIFVAVGALAVGAGTAPAQAQGYYQYNNPYYGSYPYNYGYRHAVWQWRHHYWRWYHQYYGR
jgi:hypothetical protein